MRTGVLAASRRAATELITPILVRPLAWPSASRKAFSDSGPGICSSTFRAWTDSSSSRIRGVTAGTDAADPMRTSWRHTNARVT